MNTTLLRLPRLQIAMGRSKRAIYLDIEKGLLTKPVKCGPRASAWPRDEIDAIVAARSAGATEEQIRALVDQLHSNRIAKWHHVQANLAAHH